MPSYTIYSTLWLILAISRSAVAEDEGKPTVQEAEVIVVHGSTETEASGFRSEIDLDALAGETTSVAEVLSRSVGVHVRSLGGLGSFSSISIRGSSPSHTAVFIDGVPVSKLGVASADLGAFGLEGFSQLDVHRGNVPMEFGGAAMGGAINLRTFGDKAARKPPRFSMGAGSFGAKHALADAQWKDDDLTYRFALGYRKANGDYPYLNDNGTFLRTDDDRVETRQNNGFDMVHGVARGRYEWSNTTLELGSRTSFKSQGIPGPASVQSDATSLSSVKELLDIGVLYQSKDKETQLQTKSYVFFDEETYRDRQGEVGLGIQHNRYRTLSVGLNGQLRHLVSKRHLLATSTDLSLERFGEKDLLSTESPGIRTWRGNLGLAIGDEIALTERVTLVPVMRLDFQYTNPGKGYNTVITAEEALQTRRDIYSSPRINVQVDHQGFTTKASAGRYYRAPTGTELFGDRGYVVGNPALREETGLSADLGFQWQAQNLWQAVRDVFVESAVFASRQQSAIALIATPAGTASAQNLGNAWLYGLEATANLRLGDFSQLTANYTRIHSRQTDTFASYEGKYLPLRPQNEVYARLSLGPAWKETLTLWGDASYTSGNFLDGANIAEVPSRLFFASGIQASIAKHFLLGLEVKNLTNERVESIPLNPPPRPDLKRVPRAVSDFLGYPLPGRAFYLTINAHI